MDFKRTISHVTVCLLVALLAPLAGAQTTWYVDDDAPGDPGPGSPTVSDPAEDGTAAHPFDAIQEALDAAVAGDEVIVADGTYTGVGNKDLDYGGKDLNVHSENGPFDCVIDCEGAGRGFYFHSGETIAAIANGFTITNGAAAYGAGVFCELSSNPMIMNCVISGNAASNGGGGVSCDDSSPDVVNCLIVDNTASLKGGGVLCQESLSKIINCTIVGNEGGAGGGGAQVAIGSDVTITNCIFSDNVSPEGPEIRLLGSSNPSTMTISYTDVVGGMSNIYAHSSCTLNWGDGNVDTDPLFDVYKRLPMGSPCVDAGTNNPAGGLPADDLDGNVRPLDGDGDVEPWTGVAATADMGAFETGELTTPRICVSNDDFSFIAVYGEPNPEAQLLEVWNCGVGVLDWEITEDCEWLTVDPLTGDSAGEVDLVDIDVDISGLAMGDYECELVISDPGAINDPVVVSVALRVSLPEICVSAEEFNFSAPQSAVSIEDQTLEIWNCDIGILTWSVEEDCSWLSVDPLNGDSAGEHDEVVLHVDAAGLAHGEHHCIMEVVDPAASNNPVSVDVYLWITTPTPGSLYVDDDAPLGGDGLTWGSAFTYLQDALAAAAADPLTTKIRVAGGEYLPDKDEAGAVTPNDRAATFQMLNNVVVKGGYRGLAGGGDPDDRNIALFETVLSGDIGAAGTLTDNSYHVVTGSGVNATAEFYGLTVAHGYTDRNVAGTRHGGGVYIAGGSPTFRDCTIRDNQTGPVWTEYDRPPADGAGLFCSQGSPTLICCVIEHNFTHDGAASENVGGGYCRPAENGGSGAGMFFELASPTLLDCQIMDNQTGKGGDGDYYCSTPTPGAHGGTGGGVTLNNCPQAMFLGCFISGNVAGKGGAGASDLYGGTDGGNGGDGSGVHINESENVVFVNCIIDDNSCSEGGRGGNGYDHGGEGGVGGGGAGVCSVASEADFLNCLLSGNVTGDGGDGGSVDEGNDSVGGDAGFGAGVKSTDSTVTLVNCTIASNVTGLPGEGITSGVVAGGGIYNAGGAVTISNAILWNNESAGTLEEQQLIGGGFAINYSCVEGWTGGLGGVGNIGADPLFADALNGDYRLLAASPAIDAGDDTAVPADTADIDGDGDVSERVPLDLAGLYRFADRPGTGDTGVADPPSYPYVVDMGAYEFAIFGDLNGDGAVNLSDLAALLANYGATSGVGYSDGDLDGDGDVDLSDLAALLAVYGDVCP